MADLQPSVPWQTEITSLKAGIAHIYKTKEFADVSIKVSTRIFKAHQLVLGARSAKLAAMLLKANSDHPKELDLTMDGVSEDSFEKLLHYIYTDELLDKDDIFGTYKTANLFDQKGLVKMCNAIIEGIPIDINNVCSILKMASDIDTLKTRCLGYIKDNASTVLKSTGFLKLSDENVRQLLYGKYFTQVPKMILLENVLRWGRDQFPPQDNYKLVRDLLLQTNEPILGKIGIENLSSAEIAKVVSDYKELLTMEESMQFFLHVHNPERSNLPVWCSPVE